MTRVAIIAPTLGRPGSIAPLVANVARTTPGPAHVVFVCDPDDYDTIAAVDAAGADQIRAGGCYSRKINIGAEVVSDELVFLGADDIRFRSGWLERARERLEAGAMVVGTNDLGNPRVIAGEFATHFLVRRAYLEWRQIDGEPGILHEGYRHCFCDDELIATATKRGVYAMASDSIVEHMHPDWGKAEYDEVYRYGKRTFRADRDLFRSRMRLWS